MSRSRLLTVVAMTLTVAFVLLPACPALPASAAMPTDIPSDCHGQHGSTPAPTHTCCYAGHHAPAAVQAPSPVVLMISVSLVYVPDDSAAAHRRVVPLSTDASPPPPTVLRI